ncbi:MAG: hypothetical protein NZ805_09370 [Armatimonadetes bacterium]|nr:hypothetical protein [Armatimonadota bacterium]
MPKWLWFFVFAALVWSWSLYLAGWLLTPKGHKYFWVTFDVSDYNAHLRWARQAWEGKNRFVNIFTTEHHEPKTFNFHDWLVGKIAHALRFTHYGATPGIALHMSMQIVHMLGVIVFVFAAWWLAAPILNDEQQRTYMLMLCFLGGFIWLAMPEANTFMALATMSWFVWGKALAALLMGSIVRTGTRDKGHGTREVILIGFVSGVLLGNIHPYALAPIGYALVLWFFVALLSRHLPLKFKLVSPQSLFPSPQFLISGALIALPAFAAAGWQAFAILGDPIYRAEFQFHLETPPIWDFVLNYGIFLFLALLASIYFLRQSPVPVPQSLLIAWLIGAFLAVYLTPTAQPRKLIEGAHLPMCLLAAWAWHQLVLPKTVVIRRYPTLVLLLIGGITPLTFWISQVRNFLHNDEIALHKGGVPFYLSDEHLKLIDWLAKNSKPDEAILCNYQLGNYIPILTGRRVFIGHWGGTVNVAEKLKLARKIWRGELPIDEAKKLFREHRLRYALATLYERHITKPKHEPEDCDKLKEQFRLDKYGDIVFRVGNDAIYRLNW